MFQSAYVTATYVKATATVTTTTAKATTVAKKSLEFFFLHFVVKSLERIYLSPHDRTLRKS